MFERQRGLGWTITPRRLREIIKTPVTRCLFMASSSEYSDDLNLLNILNKWMLNLCIIASKHIIGEM